MKISVTILTFNEAHNIEECLKTVQWADEIIVVDSFSQDNTIDLAKKYTDKVYQIKWKGYTKQRNWSLEKVTGDWILVLDADERITAELRQEIIAIINDASSKDGYYITRQNYFMGRPLKSSPDSHIRLFRKGKGVYAEREVHETVNLQGTIGYLRGNMIHYTYRDLEQYIQKMNGYSTLGAKELLKRKKQVSIFSLVFRSGFAFIKHYLLKRGFIDGVPGLVFSVSYAYYTFCKYAKHYELLLEERTK